MSLLLLILLLELELVDSVLVELLLSILILVIAARKQRPKSLLMPDVTCTQVKTNDKVRKGIEHRFVSLEATSPEIWQKVTSREVFVVYVALHDKPIGETHWSHYWL